MVAKKPRHFPAQVLTPTATPKRNSTQTHHVVDLGGGGSPMKAGKVDFSKSDVVLGGHTQKTAVLLADRPKMFVRYRLHPRLARYE